MPHWTELDIVLDSRPSCPRPGDLGLRVAQAAGVVPLGWMALFRGEDLVVVQHEGDELLAPFTTVAAARENLARRRGVLEEVFWQIDAPGLLDELDEQLARAAAGAHVIVWTAGLAAPWLSGEQDALAELITGLDDRDPEQWEALLAEVDARRIASDHDRLAGDFGGYSVNACVGHLRGRPAPGRDEAVPDLGAAYTRFEEVGVGRARVWADARACIAEWMPGAAQHAGRAIQLHELSLDQDEGWLAAQLPGLPPELRAAVYADAFARMPLQVDEPDPLLRRILMLVQIAYGPRAGDPSLSLAIVDPDPRVRALLAMRYAGGGDPDEDEDDEGITRPAAPDEVWRALVLDADASVRAALLRNGRTALRPSVEDPSPVVRAHHPETSQRELRMLARHRDLAVLDGVFHHPRAHLSTQLAIARALLRAAAESSWLLSTLRWTFSAQRFASAAELASTVVGEWDPDEVIAPESVLELIFEAVVDGAYDFQVVTIRTDAAQGFTAAELLWRTHEALGELPLGDRRFFEGFMRVPLADARVGEPPRIRVLQGS